MDNILLSEFLVFQKRIAANHHFLTKIDEFLFVEGIFVKFKKLIEQVSSQIDIKIKLRHLAHEMFHNGRNIGNLNLLLIDQKTQNLIRHRDHFFGEDVLSGIAD